MISIFKKKALPDGRRASQRAFPISIVLDLDGVNVFVGAGLLHQLVALLVHQQLALDALEALPTQTPDAVLAEGTEGALENKITTLVTYEI